MNNILIRFILILVLMLGGSSFSVYSKGMEGQYTMTGVAVTDKGDTLKGVSIIVQLNAVTDTIVTDSKGYFSLIIHWSTPCPSGTNVFQRRRAIKNNNSRLIFFRYNGSTVKARNKWKRSMRSRTKGEQFILKNKKLVFRPNSL